MTRCRHESFQKFLLETIQNSLKRWEKQKQSAFEIFQNCVILGVLQAYLKSGDLKGHFKKI